MKEVILIPWRPGRPDRIIAFEHTWTHLRSLGLPTYLGDSGHDRFHRGASRNAAARNAGDWDVALFTDADVLVPLPNIREALRQAAVSDHVVFPHDRYQSTRKDGRPFQNSTAPTNGGSLAISRAAFERVEGFDERFAGWGYEDAAFRLATETILGGPTRIPGIMKEQFHEKTGRGRSEEERVLYERYKHARHEPRSMLALVGEDPLELQS